MNDPMFIGLVLNATEQYVSRETAAGRRIDHEEAQLFAENCCTVYQALLNLGLQIPS